MRAELIDLDHVSSADVARWKALAARALEPNPFFEPAVVLAAAAHVASDEALSLLVVRDGESLVACTPVRRVRRGRRFPFPMLVGWRHDYSFLGSPLLDPDGAEGAARAMAALLGRHGVPRYLVLDLVGDRVARVLRGSLAVRVLQSTQRAVATRQENGAPDLGIRGKHRRELARKGRALAQSVEGELFHDLAPTAGVVDQFLVLESSGWKGRAGTALASDAGHAEFFRVACKELGADGRARFYAVGDVTNPAAMACTFTSADAAFGFKIAMDERLHSLSPGSQLLAEIPRLVFEDPRYTMVDSCADPDHELANQLWAERRNLSTVMIADGVVGRGVSTVTMRAEQLRNRRSTRESRS